VKKMLRYPAPPGYRRTQPVRRPKLEEFTGLIDAILAANRDVPRKQRHTAQRIFGRLRDEHGFNGGYTIVKDYVRQQRLTTREAFVPLCHPPSHAQEDFGEAVIEAGRHRVKAHVFFMILPHSGAWFVKANPRETPSSAACPSRFSTTTRPLRWRRSWVTAPAGAPRPSRICSPTICSGTGSAVSGRG
jgi:transposase